MVRKTPHFDVMDRIFGKIPNGPTVIVLNRFKLPAQYKKMSIETIFDAWGIYAKTIDNGKCVLALPEGWKYEFPESLRFVQDQNGSLRMRVLDKSVVVESPIVTQMTGDYEQFEWVEVLHKGNEVFRSTVFRSDDIPESPDVIDFTKGLVPADNPYWGGKKEVPTPTSKKDRELANYNAFMATKKYYDEAEDFVRKNYPLLDKDPNAYW